MKLKLPHKTHNLNMEASIEERLVIIDDILSEVVEFYDQSMTVEEYFRETWTKPNTLTCLDIIGYYLTKENRDLEVLSHKKQKEMITGSKRHVTFSSMGYDNQVAIGVIDIEEY